MNAPYNKANGIPANFEVEKKLNIFTLHSDEVGSQNLKTWVDWGTFYLLKGGLRFDLKWWAENKLSEWLRITSILT